MVKIFGQNPGFVSTWSMNVPKVTKTSKDQHFCPFYLALFCSLASSPPLCLSSWRQKRQEIA